jgi:hypothetical protein
MHTEPTEQIVAQNETGRERPVSNIRVYKDTQDELLELSVMVKRQTGTKPTFADMVELAVALYRREVEKETRGK